MKQLSAILLLIFLPALTTLGQTSSPAITAEEIKEHIKYLASDELEGRLTGTEGNRMAARYIAGLMKQYGLAPAGDSGTYFQSFDFVSSVKLGGNNACVVERKPDEGGKQELKVDTDFRPLGFTSNASVSGPVVFAGYGISAPDSKYDDYKDLDVNGKIVLVLRYGPDGNDMHSDLNNQRRSRHYGI